MKKNLIAMAVAAGLAMPMAAMAETTVYGLAHVSIDSSDDGQDSSLNVSTNASRLGFKSSMDLDNGMKAGVQFEGQVEVDEGGFNMNRNTFASLGGGFGEFRVGLHDTPFKDVRSKLDMFGDRVGDLRNLTRWGHFDVTLNAQDQVTALATTNQWDERFKNGILYISPKFGGSWTVKAHYSTNQAAGTADGPTANDDAAYSIGADGMIGPVGLWLAYENYDFTGDQKSTTGMRLGVQYKGGPLMVNFMYQTTADGVIDIDGGTAGPVSDYFDRDVMSIGLGWKMGKNTIKFQYAMANDLDCATLGSACDDTGATMYGIGLDHALSKESTVYIMYAATQNDDAPWRVTSGGGHADDVGTSIVNGEVQDPSSISAGYIVKF